MTMFTSRTINFFNLMKRLGQVLLLFVLGACLLTLSTYLVSASGQWGWLAFGILVGTLPFIGFYLAGFLLAPKRFYQAQMWKNQSSSLRWGVVIVCAVSSYFSMGELNSVADISAVEQPMPLLEQLLITVGAVILLTVLISLFIIVPGFKLSFWRTLLQLACSRLVLTGISAFVIATFVYGQLTLLVELNQPLLKGLHRPDFPDYWAAARAYDTFFVWVGLFLVLTILLEEWRLLFSRPPTFNWYYLQGVSVTLAFAVVACGEYLGLATQAWLSAVVSYVVIVLFHIGGFRFERKQPKRNTRWLI